jgi:hypothetical protein
MVPHQILAVCLRAVAVVWLLYLLSSVVSILQVAAGPDSGVPWGYFIVTNVLQLVGCAILWIFPFSIANKLLPPSGSEKDLTPVSANQWQVLILTGVAVWVLAHAIPAAAYYVVVAQANKSAGLELAIDQKAGMVATAIEFLIGVGLLIGVKRATVSIRKLQGMSK